MPPQTRFANVASDFRNLPGNGRWILTHMQTGSSPLPVTVAWTGASGLVYGVRLVDVLLRAGRNVLLLRSGAVDQTAPVELDSTPQEIIAKLRSTAADHGAKLTEFGADEFSSPAASGSAPSAGMVVCPCSLGTAARIACGISDSLLLRAADVCLKERRRLLLVPRETPLATHHLENLARLSAMGVIILPAMPGFYQKPRSVSDLVDFIVQRICDHLEVPVELVGRWAQDGSGGADR